MKKKVRVKFVTPLSFSHNDVAFQILKIIFNVQTCCWFHYFITNERYTSYSSSLYEISVTVLSPADGQNYVQLDIALA